MYINELIDAIVETAGEGADAEALGHYVRDLREWQYRVLAPALSSILDAHCAGGIDLDTWHELDRLFAPVEGRE